MKRANYLKGVFFILLLSVVAVVGLLFIIYSKESEQSNLMSSQMLSYFVLLNIVLNSASSFCILWAFRAIRLRRIAIHKKFMLLAFTFCSFSGKLYLLSLQSRLYRIFRARHRSSEFFYFNQSSYPSGYYSASSF